MEAPTGKAAKVYDMLNDPNEVREFCDKQGTHTGNKKFFDLMEGAKSAKAFLRCQDELCDCQLKHVGEAKAKLKLALTRHEQIDEMVAFGRAVKQGQRPKSMDLRYLQAIFTRKEIHPQFSSIQTITEQLL
jgi:hypothetical protein